MKLLTVLRQSMKSGFSLLEVGECNSGGILGFEMPMLSKFLKAKSLNGNFWKDEKYNDQPFREGLSLVVGADAQDDLWNSEEPRSLDRFLSHIYFATYKSLPHPNLVLASPLSLFDILPKYSNHFVNQGLDYLQNIGGKNCKPDVKPKTANWIKKEENFCGRVYVCDYSQNGVCCGEPLCYSDFAWIKKGVALFYMHTGGDIITSAFIYPFVTDCHSRS